MQTVTFVTLAIFAGYIIGFLIALLGCALFASAYIKGEELYREYQKSHHGFASVGSVLKPRSKLLIQIRKWS